MTMKRILAAAVLGASTLFAVNAHAVPANATFAGTGVNPVVTIIGTDLNSASSISWDTPDQFATSVNATYLGSANSFVTNGDMFFGDIGSNATIINIDAFAPVVGWMTWGDSTTPVNRFSWDMTTLVRNPSVAGAMDLYATGTFNDTTGFYDATPAAFRFTAQDVGGSISYSFSWGTPPFENPTGTPAPGGLALMGLGLLGLRLARRKA